MKGGRQLKKLPPAFVSDLDINTAQQLQIKRRLYDSTD